jgi:hypothetical protein
VRIAFITSSLEAGRDGVGDYTRRLAAELIRQRHPSIIVSLNDSQVAEPLFGLQEMEGTSISVLRLPSEMPWNQRAMMVRKWLDAFNPDWVSLQFVPFGFHRKGLCFGLGKRLAAMNTKASWHVMFHELWLGLGEKTSVKHRVLGALQRLIILDFMRRLRPRIVHTQAEPYRIVLSREKIKASILPLFGNIPQNHGDGWDGLLEPLVTKAMGKHQDRTKLYLAGILGIVHPEWNAELAVNTLLPLVQRFQKKLVLVFHGKNNLTPVAINHLNLTLHGRAAVVMVGERTSFEISKVLQTLDLGLATSPRQIIQKSGSVAAMLEHGLQVLVTRDDWRLRGPDSPLEEKSSRLLCPRQFALLETLPHRSHESAETGGVSYVASRMVDAVTLH